MGITSERRDTNDKMILNHCKRRCLDCNIHVFKTVTCMVVTMQNVERVFDPMLVSSSLWCAANYTWKLSEHGRGSIVVRSRDWILVFDVQEASARYTKAREGQESTPDKAITAWWSTRLSSKRGRRWLMLTVYMISSSGLPNCTCSFQHLLFMHSGVRAHVTWHLLSACPRGYIYIYIYIFMLAKEELVNKCSTTLELVCTV